MNLSRSSILLLSLSVITLWSCKDDDNGSNVIYTNANQTYSDGVSSGETVSIDNQEVSESISVEGGVLDVSGSSYLDAVNIDAEGGNVTVGENASVHTVDMDNGSLLVDGDAEIRTEYNMDGGTSVITDNASMNSFNMDGGHSTISGSANVNVDLNFNGGTVRFGDQFLQDTVHIGNNFNASDSVWIDWGVVVIGTDLNLNDGAFLSVSDSAQLVVNHNLNSNGVVSIYGGRNITVEHDTNLNGGEIHEAPYGQE